MTSFSHQIVLFQFVLLYLCALIVCQQPPQILQSFLNLNRNFENSTINDNLISNTTTSQSQRELNFQKLEQNQNQNQNQVQNQNQNLKNDQKILDQNDQFLELNQKNQSTSKKLVPNETQQEKGQFVLFGNEFGKAKVQNEPEELFSLQNSGSQVVKKNDTGDLKGQQSENLSPLDEDEVEEMFFDRDVQFGEEFTVTNNELLNSQNKSTSQKSTLSINNNNNNGQNNTSNTLFNPQFVDEYVRTKIIHNDMDNDKSVEQVISQIPQIEDHVFEIQTRQNEDLQDIAQNQFLKEESNEDQIENQIAILDDQETDMIVKNFVESSESDSPPQFETSDLEEQINYYNYGENQYLESENVDEQMFARNAFFFVEESSRPKIIEDSVSDSKVENNAEKSSDLENQSKLRNGFSDLKDSIQNQFVSSRIASEAPRASPQVSNQSPKIVRSQFLNSDASSKIVTTDNDKFSNIQNIQSSPITLNLTLPSLTIPQPTEVQPTPPRTPLISPVQINIPPLSLPSPPKNLVEFGSSRIFQNLSPIVISLPDVPLPLPSPPSLPPKGKPLPSSPLPLPSSPLPLPLPLPSPPSLPPKGQSIIPSPFLVDKNTLGSNFKPIPSIFDPSTRPLVISKLENEILRKIYESGKFSKFLNLLDRADSLEGLFPQKKSLFSSETEQKQQQLRFTMLAPTDEAFNDFFEWMSAMGYKKPEKMFQDWEYMGRILGYHIVPEDVLESTDFKNFTVLKTLQGSEIVALMDGKDGKLRIHDSCIDQPTKNGHSCEYEARWGKCFDDFMLDSGGAGWRGGYCQRTCKRCSCFKDSDWPCSIVASPDVIKTDSVVVHGISRVLFPMNPEFINSFKPSTPNFARKQKNIQPQPYAFHPVVRAGTMPRDQKAMEMISKGWRIGRGTHYGWNDGGSIHRGSCQYGYLCPNKGTGWDIAALADVHEDYQDSCGTCYEVRCNPMEVYDLWGQKDMRYQDICRDEYASVIVTITDTCPCIFPKNYYSNMRWCCGDMDHMDLSVWAFEKLSASVDKGVIGLWYRKVSCDYKPWKTAKLPYKNSKYPGQKPWQYHTTC